jgi:hypothetical protein
MLITPPPEESMDARIVREIHIALQKRVDEIKAKIVADAVKEFDAQVREAVGMVAIDLATYYSVEMTRGELLVRVRLEKQK